MTVACPQCGAPAEALTETRFYRCGYCSSAFVVQGERGIEQFTISHQRDDRLAWSALAEHVERHGMEQVPEQDQVRFLLIPFWCFVTDGGATRMAPAATLELPELSRVTLPGGDLRYPRFDEELPAPEVSLADAEQRLKETTFSRRFLLYLPCYLLSYRCGGHPCQALVSGVDRKVYSPHLPVARELTIPRRNFLMIGLYAAVLVLEGVWFRHPGWRAVAFVLTGLAAWAICGALLRRAHC